MKLPGPPPTRLWLVRHAEVEAAYQGIFGGRIDMNLSPRGHEQAVALARYLQAQPLQALYASPMKRVQQTLEPFLKLSPLQPVTVPELREVDFGEWTGLNWDQVQAQFGASAFSWLEQLEKASIPKAENAVILRERLAPCLNRIIAAHAGQQVGVFCHGGVIRVLISMLLDWPLSRMASFQVEYASISRIALPGHKTELQLINFTPWRDLHA